MKNRMLWCVVALFAGDILVNNMANARVGAPGFMDPECLSLYGHYFWPEQIRCKGEVKKMTWTEETAAHSSMIGDFRGFCCIPAPCPDVCSGDIVTETAPMCPVGWTPKNAGLGCLKIVNQRKSWSAARTYCQGLADTGVDLGADLLVADTSDKLLELEKLMNEDNSRSWYWAGGQRIDGSQKWVIEGEEQISNGWLSSKYHHTSNVNSNVNYCTRIKCNADRNCQIDEKTCNAFKFFICQIPA